MKVDLDDLERKARAATPGPWRLGDWSAVFGTRERPERMLIIERNLTHAGPEPYVCGRGDGRFEVLRLDEPVSDEANALHIAANSPSVTLALVARIRELEAQAHRTIEATGLTVEDELETLRKLLEKVTVIA